MKNRIIILSFLMLTTAQTVIGMSTRWSALRLKIQNITCDTHNATYESYKVDLGKQGTITATICKEAGTGKITNKEASYSKPDMKTRRFEVFFLPDAVAVNIRYLYEDKFKK